MHAYRGGETKIGALALRSLSQTRPSVTYTYTHSETAKSNQNHNTTKTLNQQNIGVLPRRSHSSTESFLALSFFIFGGRHRAHRLGCAVSLTRPFSPTFYLFKFYFKLFHINSHCSLLINLHFFSLPALCGGWGRLVWLESTIFLKVGGQGLCGGDWHVHVYTNKKAKPTVSCQERRCSVVQEEVQEGQYPATQRKIKQIYKTKTHKKNKTETEQEARPVFLSFACHAG